MTLLPRITTSPMVSPSRGDVVHVVVDDPDEVGDDVRLALAGSQARACSSAGSSSQSGASRRR